MLVIADAGARGGGGRRDGRRRLRGLGVHPVGGARKRLVQPAARCAAPARPWVSRPKRAPGSSAAWIPTLPPVAMARACALLRQLGANPAGTSIDCHPAPVTGARRCTSGARDWPACSGSPCRTPTCCASCARSGSRLTPAADGWNVDGADQPRGHDARGGPDRGGGAAPRLRPHADDLPCPGRGAAAERSASRTGAPPAGRDDRRGVLRGHDLRLRGGSRRRAVCAGRRHRGASPTRCRRPSPCCGRRCCRACWTASVTTGAASSPTCACSKSARASRAAARRTPRASRSPGPARPIRPTGHSPPPPVTFFDVKGVVERDLPGARRTGVDRGGVGRPEVGRGDLAGARPVGRRRGQRCDARRLRASGGGGRRAARDPSRRRGLRRRTRLGRRAAPGPARRFASRRCPRFPSVSRDVALLVDDTLPAATLRDTIRAAAPATLVQVREFDRYQGKGIPEGKISLAVRLTFRSADRTLTDAEVQAAMDADRRGGARDTRRDPALGRRRRSRLCLARRAAIVSPCGPYSFLISRGRAHGW